MSTAQQSPITETCEHCGTDFQVHDSPRPNHCSDECYFKYKGEKALNQTESDHTVCATCQNRIKTIEKPPQGVSLNIPPSDHEQSNGLTENVLIGYQYQTEHTKRYADESGAEPNPIFYTRWSCECGTVNPNERDDILEGIDLPKTVKNLCDRLSELSSQDAIGGTFSYNRFLEAFNPDERNWAYAVGYCLYGPESDK